MHHTTTLSVKYSKYRNTVIGGKQLLPGPLGTPTPGPAVRGLTPGQAGVDAVGTGPTGQGFSQHPSFSHELKHLLKRQASGVAGTFLKKQGWQGQHT